jgi:hypothetical protein
MAKGISIKGIERAIKGIEKQINNRVEKIDAAMQDSVDTMANEAKSLVPVYTGLLRSKIFANKLDKLKYQLLADTPYAAYIEFGTRKTSVAENLSDYWKKIAEQYKVTNPKKLTNTEAAQYFYISVNKNFPKLKDKISKIVK